MKYFKQVKKEQEKIIKELRLKTSEFIVDRIIPIDKINACLLSGSVSRGDYFPGEFNGAIDLTIFVKDKNQFDLDIYLGESESEIKSFHMIKTEDEQFFQIKIYDNEYFQNYKNMDEAGKYALIESEIIYDRNDEIKKKIEYLKKSIIEEEIEVLLYERIEYSKYLINEYKIDRWKRRNAVIQLSQNLSKAIELSIKCLFNINGLYAPADDRALYYSFALIDLPINYKEIMDEIIKINELSLHAYESREKLYKGKLLEFIEKRYEDRFK